MINSKTIDLSILSNYKSSTYTNSVGVIENFSDLRQYIGSEYCLIGGERNRSPLVEDNGMIKYDNSNSYATTNEWIPIGNLKVTRVTLKYQKPYTSNTSWYKFSIFLSKLSDSDNEVYTSVVVNDTSTQSQTWYEVDVDFNSIEVNYFKINAIVGRVFIKDIVIYYQDDEPKSGGAGSGYIGNSLVSNKKMVGYNVPTSSAEGTKTESVNDVSSSAVSGKPKSGNGFARIKFLRDLTIENIPVSVINQYFISQYSGGQIPYEIPTSYPDVIPYLGTDYCIIIGDTNKKKLDVENDYMKYDNDSYSCSTGEMIPIPHKIIRNVKFKYKKVTSSIPAYWWFDFMLVRINNETGAYVRGMTIVDDQSQSASSDWVSIDYDCNFEANYICIWGVTGKWYAKDIQITY